jgi:hypothetical protein
MKPIDKDELFQNISGFLKTKGIELTDGSYANGIQKSCSLLADAINLGQQGFERAKTEVDKRLDQVRQVIHEKTAPKPPPTAQAEPPPTNATATQAAAPTQGAPNASGSAPKKGHTKAAKRSKSGRRR